MTLRISLHAFNCAVNLHIARAANRNKELVTISKPSLLSRPQNKLQGSLQQILDTVVHMNPASAKLTHVLTEKDGDSVVGLISR